MPKLTLEKPKPIITRPIALPQLKTVMPELVALLMETVDGGVPLGFQKPLAREEASNYWLSLRAEMQAGSRLLLAAYDEDRLVGSGQLALSTWTTGRHRAEIQKLFVTTGLRGRGVGRSLMMALHDAARQHGRSLLILNTRRGLPAEHFYDKLGYQVAGVIPGYTIGPAGERYDTVTLYHELPL